MIAEGARPVDVFATVVSRLTDTDMQRLTCLYDTAPWRDVPGRDYDAAEVQFWEPCTRAFFIRIPPGGAIPRHHDEFITGTTHHLVLMSNEGCENWWIDTKGRERCVHLEQGFRYQVERSPLHWAVNRGDSTRIHLLAEFE